MKPDNMWPMCAKTACMDFSSQNNWLSAGWDNFQHASSNGQNILVQNVFLTKTVKDIGNRYSLQQDGYSVIWHNDLKVKVILPRKVFWLKQSRRLNPSQFVAWLANLIFFLLIRCCLKIQQQLGQKTNLPCAEVIAMITTGLHYTFGIKNKHRSSAHSGVAFR